jgi:hypothetical protein
MWMVAGALTWGDAGRTERQMAVIGRTATDT